MQYLRLLLCLSLFFSLPAIAQEAKTDTAKAKDSKRIVALHGSVYDSFTRVPLKAKMTLMTADSSVVDTTTVQLWEPYCSYGFRAPRKTADYIIHAVMPGYEDAWKNFRVRIYARKVYFDVPEILMKKKADDVWRTDTIDGVVVTGTRIKMIQRGDTIIYDAAAFKLPDGSMLDGLIRQLPGAELKSNGDIYINGRKLDYLTLNGTDFFKGENKVMLENLPYYTVKNLKVYNKETEMSKIMGRDVEKRDYVMDVTLKPEYNRGYMANVEGGMGTQGRYMGRIFGLYYDDNTRLSVFGNINNVNETREPGGNGDWQPSNMPMGLTTTKQAGLNLNVNDKQKRFTESFGATAQWTDANYDSWASSERFASSGNLFSRNISSSRSKNYSVRMSNNFFLMKPFGLYTQINVTHSMRDNRSHSRSGTFKSEPYGDVYAALDSAFTTDMGELINRSFSNSWGRSSSDYVNAALLFGHTLPWGDDIRVNITGTANRTKPADQLSRNGTYYAQTGQTDFRYVYADTRTNGYRYDASVEYNLNLNEHIGPGIRLFYQHNYSKNRGLNYRLEQLHGQYAEADDAFDYDHKLTSYLPSTRDSLQMSLDAQNSSAYTLHTGELSVVPFFAYHAKNGLLQVSLGMSRYNQHLNYHGAGIDTVATRNYNKFEPSIEYYDWSSNTTFSYQMSSDLQDIVSTMPVMNDLNPLVRRINNPNLKRTTAHSFYASHDFKLPRSGTFGISANYGLTVNSVGTRTTYNTKTGAYTFMSDNVDGSNWNASGRLTLNLPLDSARHFMFYSQLSEDYSHSVDFDIAYNEASTALSRVNNFNTTATSRLTWSKGEYTIGVGGNVQWQNANGNRANFQTINAWNFDYAMNLSMPLPWKFFLATDLRMFSRRGYQEAKMNTDDLVWNAQLSRSFLKGHLTATLQAFDILHQLSSTSYTINAQGRTESWYRSIPRYAMLRLAYKFQKSPKKKQ